MYLNPVLQFVICVLPAVYLKKAKRSHAWAAHTRQVLERSGSCKSIRDKKWI